MAGEITTSRHFTFAPSSTPLPWRQQAPLSLSDTRGPRHDGNFATAAALDEVHLAPINGSCVRLCCGFCGKLKVHEPGFRVKEGLNCLLCSMKLSMCQVDLLTVGLRLRSEPWSRFRFTFVWNERLNFPYAPKWYAHKFSLAMMRGVAVAARRGPRARREGGSLTSFHKASPPFPL